MEFRPVWVLKSNDGLWVAAVVEACFGRSPPDELAHLLTFPLVEQKPMLGHNTLFACSRKMPQSLKFSKCSMWQPSEKAYGGPKEAMPSSHAPPGILSGFT